VCRLEPYTFCPNSTNAKCPQMRELHHRIYPRIEFFYESVWYPGLAHRVA
jgi:hypothetical protein